MLGPQGCGKGTIGEKLSSLFELPLISVGQILRDLPSSSPYYKDIHISMLKGNLAPNVEVAYVLKAELESGRYSRGFVMDGWARQVDDLNKYDPGFDVVVLLNISEETTLKRLSSRRTCSSCGKVYNVLFNKPKTDNICDVCGNKLIQREDDKEEAIKNRLHIYLTETVPVIEKYRNEGKIVEINAEPSIEEVFRSTVFALANLNIV